MVTTLLTIYLCIDEFNFKVEYLFFSEKHNELFFKSNKRELGRRNALLII